jgi:hypothetical protein
MKQAFCKNAILGVLVLLVAVLGSSAQTLDRGAIHGFVYDTSGSAIPGAKVTLTSSATGLKRDTTTNADGAYDFEALIPGEYTLVFESGNFATYTVKQVVVTIGSSISLDAHLKVKTAEQSITVTAEAAGAIDTTTSGITQLLDSRSLDNLPFPGRDYRDLAQLTASAQVVPGLRGNIRLGGQQSDYTGLVIDGADTTNNFFGENFGSLETKNLTVPIEAVQEFQVVTNGFAPEFGRATGGLLNVVTKSGTNDVHGEAHEYFRSGSLSKNDALGNPSSIDKQNQFGGSVGFPIHKDRQFLFLSTDIQRNNGPLTTNLCHGNATCQADAGPLVQASAGDVLSSACVSGAVGMHLLPACYGVPNLGALEGPHPQFQDFFTLLGHYDYQINAANHFSIRGFGTRNHTRGFTGGHGQSETFDAFGDTEDFVNQGISGVFALTTLLGRNVNEIRASIEGETRKRHPIFKGAPEVFIQGVGEFGQRFYLPGNNDNGKLQVQDNFSYAFSKHDVKFGGDVNSFVDRKDVFAGWSAGRYNFANLAAFDTGTGGNAYFQGFGLNGQTPFQANTLPPEYQTGIGLYAQDKWQVSPRLTVTYGLRWDGTRNPQPSSPIPGQMVYTGVGPLGSGTKISPVPQNTPNDYSQWGPRVGVAWNLSTGSHPTVARAAWGFYYAQTPTIFFPATSNGGGSKSTTLFGNPAFGTAPSEGPPYVFFPSNLPQSSSQLCALATPAIGCPSITYADPALRNPRVSNLTVGVEHRFAGDWTASANYAFMHSTHLKTGGFSTSTWIRNLVPMGTDQFGRSILAAVPATGACPADAQVFPGEPLPLDCSLSNFSGANELASFSRGNYHQFTAGIDKRFSHHYQFFANYTWSRNFSNDSSERDTDTFFGTQDPFNINIDYGRNGLDITHQFKSGIVAELPWGLNWSSNFIAHSGLAYPAYSSADINGDTVINQFSNNDRPVVQLGSGAPFLLPRYPARQPAFFTWDMRVSKDFKLGERYSLRLVADIFNVTNASNLYSNPDNSGFVTLSNCGLVNPGVTLTTKCDSLTAIPKQGNVYLNAAGQPVPYGVHDEISPGSTALAAQFGVRFQF